MEEPASIPVACPSGRELRRLQRERILTTLKGVCLQIGRLHPSKQGRLACREVVQILDEALARESGPPGPRRR